MGPRNAAGVLLGAFALVAAQPGAPVFNTVVDGETSVSVAFTPADTLARTWEVKASVVHPFTTTYTGGSVIKEDFIVAPATIGGQTGGVPAVTYTTGGNGNASLLGTTSFFADTFAWATAAQTPSFFGWRSTNIVGTTAIPTLTSVNEPYIVMATINDMRFGSATPNLQAGLVMYDFPTTGQSNGRPRWLFRSYVSQTTTTQRFLGHWAYPVYGNPTCATQYNPSPVADGLSSLPIVVYIRYNPTNGTVQAGFQRIGYDTKPKWASQRVALASIYNGATWGTGGMPAGPIYMPLASSTVRFGFFGASTTGVASNVVFDDFWIFTNSQFTANRAWSSYWAMRADGSNNRGGVCGISRDVVRVIAAPSATRNPVNYTLTGLASLANFSLSVTGIDGVGTRGTTAIFPRVISTALRPPVSGAIFIVDAQTVPVGPSIGASGAAISSIYDAVNQNLGYTMSDASNLAGGVRITGPTAAAPYNSLLFDGLGGYLAYDGDDSMLKLNRDQTNNNFTFMMMYKPTGVAGVTQQSTVFAKSSSSGDNEIGFAYHSPSWSQVNSVYSFSYGLRISDANYRQLVAGATYGTPQMSGSFPTNPHSYAPTIVTMSYNNMRTAAATQYRIDACTGSNRGLTTDQCNYPAQGVTPANNPWGATMNFAPYSATTIGNGNPYNWGTSWATMTESTQPFTMGSATYKSAGNLLEWQQRYVGSVQALYVWRRPLSQSENLQMQMYLSKRFNQYCPAATAFSGALGTCNPAIQGETCLQSCDTAGTTTGGIVQYQKSGTGFLTCSNGAWNGKGLACAAMCPTVSAPVNYQNCRKTFESRNFTSGRVAVPFSLIPDWDIAPYMPIDRADNIWSVQPGVGLTAAIGSPLDSCDTVFPSGLFINQPNYLDAYPNIYPLSISTNIRLAAGSVGGLMVRAFTNTTFYRITMTAGSNATRIERVVNSIATAPTILNVATTAARGVIPAINTWHTIRVDVNTISSSSANVRLVVYINGTMIYNVTDNLAPISGGSYGVWAASGTVNFDNFQVTGLCDNNGASCRNLMAGQSCSFACKSGYSMNPTNADTVTCGVNGTLSTVPDCRPLPPIFGTRTFSIPENATTDTVVGTVAATPRVAGQLIMYTVLPINNAETMRDRNLRITGFKNPVFNIGACSGTISLDSGGVLNFATGSRSFSLRISACAEGRTDQFCCTNATIVVAVANVPNAPSFDPDTVSGSSATYLRYVKALSAVGTNIAPAVTAYTPEVGRTLIYTIVQGNTGNAFTITSTTGILRVNARISYWSNPSYNLLIQAADSVFPSLTARMWVNVQTNWTNEAPTAVATQDFEIMETRMITNTVIGSVVASDLDALGGRDTLRYNLTAGNLTKLWMDNTKGDNQTGAFRVKLTETYNNVQNPIFVMGSRMCRAYYIATMMVTDSYGLNVNVQIRVYVLANVTIAGFPRVDSAIITNALLQAKNPNSMATAGGDRIVLRGQYFSTITQLANATDIFVSYTSQASDPFPFRNYVALSCSVTADDTIVCTSVPGFGANLAISANWGRSTSLYGVTSVSFSTTALVSYNKPVITSITCSVGCNVLPTAGGTTITVTGTDLWLATAPTASSVANYFGNSFTGVITSRAATQIRFTTVAGVGSSMNVTVSLGNSAGTGATRLTYSPPVITSVTANTGSLLNLSPSGGTLFTIRGTNFGPVNVLPVVVYRTLSTVATLVASVSTNILYHYLATSCTKSAVTAHTTITCTTVPGVGRNMYVQMQLAGYTINSAQNIVGYATPAVTSITGAGATGGDTAGGQAIVFAGSNLGPVGAIGSTSMNYRVVPISITYGPTGREFLATACSVTATNRITCLNSPGFGRGLIAIIRVAGLVASQSANLRIAYAPPTVISFYRNDSTNDLSSFVTQGGEEVRIVGKNFGPYMAPDFSARYKVAIVARQTQFNTTLGDSRGAVTFTVAQGGCRMVVPNTEIACTTTSGAGAGLTWTLVVAGQNSTYPVTSYSKPSIANVTDLAGFPVVNATTDGGSMVVINGDNFGPRLNCFTSSLMGAGTCHGYVQSLTYGPTGTEYMVQEYNVLSHQQIVATLAPGFGKDLVFVVTVADQVSEVNLGTASYASPSITSITPWFGTTLPTDANPVLVTINGTNFGLLDSTAAVGILFGNALDGSQLSTMLSPFAQYPNLAQPATLRGRVLGGTHSLTFFLKPGLGPMRGVRVVTYYPVDPVATAVSSDPVADAAAGGQPGFSYNMPRLDVVVVQAPGSFRSPVNATSMDTFIGSATSSGALPTGQQVLVLTLFGSDFGPDDDFNGDSISRFVEWRDPNTGIWTSSNVVIYSWNHTKIVAATSYDSGQVRASFNSTLYNGSTVITSSNPFYFTELSPVANLVGSPAPFDTRGGAIVNFTASNLLSAGFNVSATVNGFDCPLIDMANQIVPPTQIISRIVQNQAYQYNPNGPTGNPADTIWTLRCIVPPGEGANVPLVVLRDGAPSDGSTLISYQAPVISGWQVWRPADNAWETVNYVPGTGGALISGNGDLMRSATNGTRIRIFGTNFGLCPSILMFDTLTRYLGSRANCRSKPANAFFISANATYNHTYIEFDGVPGEGLRQVFSLEVAGQRISTAIYVNYDAPIITAVTINGTTRGGDRIDLQGHNFGVSTPSIIIGPSVCTNVTRVSHNAAYCVLPVGSGRNLDVILSIASQTGILPASFSYLPPVVSYLLINGQSTMLAYDSATGFQIPVRGPTSGGFNVTIVGDNFGNFTYNRHCLFVPWRGRALNAQVVCDNRYSFIGENEVPIVAIRSWSHTEITFVFPPGFGAREILPWVNGQGPAAPVVFHYDAPEITEDLMPGYGTTDGGTLITVRGASFGTRQAQTATEINAIMAAPLPSTLTAYLGSISVPQARFSVFFNRICLSSYVDGSGNRPSTVSRCSPSSITSHAHSTVRFLSQMGVGANRTVYVQVDDIEPDGMGGYKPVQYQSNAANFSYLPPSFTFINPSPVLMDGTPGKIARFDGENIGKVPTDNTGVQVPWTDDELQISIVLGGRFTVYSAFADDANPDFTSSPVRESRLDMPDIIRGKLPDMPVGFHNVSYKVAGQSNFNCDNVTTCVPLFVACGPEFFGRPGETCMACPSGASCGGFDATNVSTPEALQAGGTHTYPRPLNGYFNLNGSMSDACPASQVIPGRDVCIVPCEPPEACCADGTRDCDQGSGIGDNYCSTGYISKAPMYRCADCAPNFYKRANECIKCPDQVAVAALLVVFAFLIIFAAVSSYILNKKRINIAFLSIAIDYFQVLAIFAQSKIPWPAAIKELFALLSAFNLNIEIVAPECLVPDLGFVKKWSFIIALPVSVAAFFGIVTVLGMFWKRCIKGKKIRMQNESAALVSSVLLLMYVLYIYLTRTILDIYNCTPTTPPEYSDPPNNTKQILYLTAVFEQCGKPGGVQLTLLPWAIVATVVYIVGYPVAIGTILYRNRRVVMLDQLRRAKNSGDDKLSSDPEAYAMRKKFSRLYYQFKPDYFFWVLCIAFRKFCVAATYVLFNKNASFQLAAVLLILFVAYAGQVRYLPYMGPAEFDGVVRSHVASSYVPGSIHSSLRATIAQIEQKGKKRASTAGLRRKGSVDYRQVLGVLTGALFNYNFVESMMIFCAIIICLMGVMFSAQKKAASYYSSSRDALTSVVLIVAIVSIIYLVCVIVTEIYIMCNEHARAKALEKQIAIGNAKKDGSRKSVTGEKDKKGAAAAAALQPEIDVGDVTNSLNPMMLGQSGKSLVTEQKKGQVDVDAASEVIAAMNIPPSNQELWLLYRTTFAELLKRVEELRQQYEAFPEDIKLRATANKAASTPSSGPTPVKAGSGASSDASSGGGSSFANPMARAGGAAAGATSTAAAPNSAVSAYRAGGIGRNPMAVGKGMRKPSSRDLGGPAAKPGGRFAAIPKKAGSSGDLEADDKPMIATADAAATAPAGSPTDDSAADIEGATLVADPVSSGGAESDSD